jgi:hypothetical protein
MSCPKMTYFQTFGKSNHPVRLSYSLTKKMNHTLANLSNLVT